MEKKKNTKRLRKAIIIATCLIVSIGLTSCGTYFFVYTIVSKKVSGMELSLSDEVKPSGKKALVYTDWYASQPFEEMRITTKDGLELVGRYIAAEDTTDKLAILIHGYMMDGSIMAAYGKHYQEDGFNVFIADNRGHGESGGTYVGMGWLDRLDYLQWLDYLLEKKGDNLEIVIHGISMGGATVACLSGEQLPKQVKCLIEDCSFNSVYDEFKYQGKKKLGFLTVPTLSIASVESKLFAGYGFKEASPLKQISKSVTPIFIIHGESDTFNPPYMAHELYDAATCEKELWIVPDAEHGKAFDVNPDQYFERVRLFYKKYINGIQDF
jgi:Prolyl oligopeptidase family.